MTAALVGWPRDEALARLHDMLRIRRMEERCAQLYGEQKIRGFLHLAIGEEAVAAGVLAHLQPQDKVVATYREHGHALLRGVMRAKWLPGISPMPSMGVMPRRLFSCFIA